MLFGLLLLLCLSESIRNVAVFYFPTQSFDAFTLFTVLYNNICQNDLFLNSNTIILVENDDKSRPR